MKQDGLTFPPQYAMNSTGPIPRRRLPLKIFDLEMAFESAASFESGMLEGPARIYLDLETGQIVWPETDEEGEDFFFDEQFLAVPQQEDRDEYRDLEDFISSLDDGARRAKLSEAIEGRGAFRRFRNIIHGSGDIELRHAWHWFETRRLRERIVAWLEDAGIEPQWDRDIFEPPTLPNPRPELLRAVFDFVQRARRLDGIRRVALLGSLATDKRQPKDVDLVIVVDDTVPLGPLARSKRQLQGKTMQTGDSRGADVFLSNPAGEYIGRICQWKICRPGIRQACEAQHCGRREFLYDDLHNVRVDRESIAHPSIELWPNPGPGDAEVPIPQDVAEILLEPLRMEVSNE